jgi:hypothetical protein
LGPASRLSAARKRRVLGLFSRSGSTHSICLCLHVGSLFNPPHMDLLLTLASRATS